MSNISNKKHTRKLNGQWPMPKLFAAHDYIFDGFWQYPQPRFQDMHDLLESRPSAKWLQDPASIHLRGQCSVIVVFVAVRAFSVETSSISTPQKSPVTALPGLFFFFFLFFGKKSLDKTEQWSILCHLVPGQTKTKQDSYNAKRLCSPESQQVNKELFQIKVLSVLHACFRTRHYQLLSTKTGYLIAVADCGSAAGTHLCVFIVEGMWGGCRCKSGRF